MKRALLWLGPLACLALAGLYAYAWFTRDPLAVAIDCFKPDMTVDEVAEIVGRPPDEVSPDVKDGTPSWTTWKSECYQFDIWSEHGRTVMFIDREPVSMADKIHKWVHNLSSLWNPGPPPPPPFPGPPPPPPFPAAGGNPRDYDVGYVAN